MLLSQVACSSFFLFFLYQTSSAEIYSLSLHDALPIWWNSLLDPEWRFLRGIVPNLFEAHSRPASVARRCLQKEDRKSTRLNSSHLGISYAVFCLKKKSSGIDGNKTLNTPETIRVLLV